MSVGSVKPPLRWCRVIAVEGLTKAEALSLEAHGFDEDLFEARMLGEFEVFDAAS